MSLHIYNAISQVSQEDAASLVLGARPLSFDGVKLVYVLQRELQWS